LTDTGRPERHRQAPSEKLHTPVRRHRAGLAIGLIVCAAVVLVAMVMLFIARPSASTRSDSTGLVRYLGVYEPDAPGSYADIDQLAKAIGRQPNIVLYYDPWLGKFQTGFATSAARHGAVTLVQINTGRTSLASIASGRYDSYWRSYADKVKAFGGQVILSIDHEMNGNWEAWGYEHQSPAAFVAAWRHVVTIFRKQGARNVTWLWTVNITDRLNDVTEPAPWWPGSSYVNWVGIDGYYYSPSTVFSSLFGATIADVRELTDDPIIIAETGAASSADQSAKIGDLFLGVRTFGLLGFVLFDKDGVHETQSWRIGSPAAYAALRQNAEAYMKPPS
jgi:Glycosyl hydrolase family 26